MLESDVSEAIVLFCVRELHDLCVWKFFLFIFHSCLICICFGFQMFAVAL